MEGKDESPGSQLLPLQTGECLVQLTVVHLAMRPALAELAEHDSNDRREIDDCGIRAGNIHGLRP